VNEVPVWSIEQVVALASSSARFAAAEAIAVPTHWSHTGGSERALWGRFTGTAAEPYEVRVDHVGVAWRCTCPSRQQPCKHVLALLVLWVRGHVAPVAEPRPVAAWADRRDAARGAADRGAAGPDGSGPGGSGAGEPVGGPSPGAGPSGASDTGDAGDTGAAPPAGDTDDDRERQRNERVERLHAGLAELDRWLDDRLRTGLADPAIARFSTWDDLAARLTDAKAGSLANRVRRLAGRVGTSPDWHADVLGEIGVLHLIATAGRHLAALPPDLADTVAVACGWLVRTADVVAGAPETDTWLVAGRSDVREDLIEVRRVWLRGIESGRWGLALSFAAYGQSLDTSLPSGTVVDADLHRYPGNALRVIVGERRAAPIGGREAAGRAARTIAAACDDIGAAFAAEPWLERHPVIVRAAPSPVAGPGPTSWALTDDTGSLPLAAGVDVDALGTVLAASAGEPVIVAAEWTSGGLVPLTVFLADRALDVGPRADPSFVGAA